MADAQSLEIRVDTDVHMSSKDTPRKVIAAIRRQLLQHGLSMLAREGDQNRQLRSLIETQGGEYRLPQALLPKVTETCQHYGIPYNVIDHRAMVSCSAMRCQHQLTDVDRSALTRLLLRDCGVLVGLGTPSRTTLTLALSARRRQRTLLVAETPQEAKEWSEQFQNGLSLLNAQILTLESATADAWVVVGTYEELAGQQARPTLRNDYGMVIFDGLSSVDARTLMRTIRAVGARYLLGLSREEQRPDGLQGAIFLALGGIAHTLLTPENQQHLLPLTCRFQNTPFDFVYQGRRQYQAMIAVLASDPHRCQMIAEQITTEGQAGQCCLVLSERRDHLENLNNRLPADIASETITSAIHPSQRAKIIARFNAGEVKILLATSQIALESLSTAKVHRLFLTFPFTYTQKLNPLIEGLLQRAPDQTDAIVFDYDDASVAPLHRAFEKRQRFLQKLKRARDKEIKQQRQLKLPLGPF